MKEFFRNENGQGLVEYALILALISVVAIAALTTVGEKVDATIDDVADELVAASA